MLRKAGGLTQILIGKRIMVLEPYTSTFQLSCNNVSTKANEANSQKLPRLPVPKLEHTLSKYLETVRPHLNDDEFEKTTKIVKDFGADGGLGQKLQTLLEKRAEKHVNWLEEWWLSTAYLGYRDPVVVYSSPGLVFPFRKFTNQSEQLMYAAKTIMAAIEYKALIDNDKIPLEMMGKNPLDMSQYKKIFGTCRIPALPTDKLSYNDSKHITVIHNNNIFHLDVYGDDNQLLNAEQLAEQLNKIVSQSLAPSPTPIGYLTSENRDTWAKAYDIIIKDERNRDALSSVERSLAVLCLDAGCGLWSAAEYTQRQNLAAAQTIHGGGSAANGGNRWFDKTVQFIVGADGVTGLTYEHSPAEGQPIAVLTDFIIDYIDKKKPSSSSSSSSLKPPVKLEFHINADVAAMIETAKKNLDKLAGDLELNCFTFTDYGKDFIKLHKMSPDSYLQMAMQYAFYIVHGEAGAHYESAATRMFAGGRTETIRSCSPQSVQFARAMLQPASPARRRDALRDAVTAHKNYASQAVQGLGVDRHLLGLKLTAIENGIELPALYSDVGYTKSAHMRLSTSQVACRCEGFMCYGPLVRDGYATCYNPRARDVLLATSALRDPRAALPHYAAALRRALADMAALLASATPSKL